MSNWDDLIPTKVVRFFEASWIYFALAIVFSVVVSYVRNYDRQPVDFAMVSVWGIPMWIGVPSVVAILIGLGFMLHGLKIVTVERNTIVKGEDFD